MPRLTQTQIDEIYSQRGKKHAYTLAEKYKVSPTTIYNVWKGQAPKTYKDALHKIRKEIEKVRGHPVDDPLFQMWARISHILDEVLE